MTKPMILVTAAAGFAASHIVHQLLQAGYRVRGTARGKRLAVLNDMFSSYTNFEAVEVKDLASDNLHNALEGAGAVFHTASPMIGRTGPEETIRSAVDGALNVLRQAHDMGIRKFVFLSTWGTLLGPNLQNAYNGSHLDQSTYAEVTREDGLDSSRGPVYVYVVSKVLAEEAAWEFAQTHPDLDLATVNPSWIYGPHISGYTVSGPEALGSNVNIYNLLTKPTSPVTEAPTPWMVDARDLARAHIALLDVPAMPNNIKRKRYPLATAQFWPEDALKCIAERRSELRLCLRSAEDAGQVRGPLSSYDIGPTIEDLRLDEFIPWETTVIDTVDDLLAMEKTW